MGHRIDGKAECVKRIERLEEEEGVIYYTSWYIEIVGDSGSRGRRLSTLSSVIYFIG